MAKNSKEDISASSEVPREVRGLVTVVFAIVCSLSLLSFREGQTDLNWLGLLGYSISFGLQYAFGLGSYICVAFMAYIGWCLLAHRPLPHPGLKTFHCAVIVVSLSVLLSALADRRPDIAALFDGITTSQVYESYAPLKRVVKRTLLGGFPAYYLYKDHPTLSFERIFGNVGVFLVFGASFLSSLLLITNKSLFAPFHMLKELFLTFVERAQTKKEDLQEVIEEHRSVAIDFIPPPPPPRPSPKSVPKAAPEQISVPNGTYTLPPLNLLSEPKKADQSKAKNNLKDLARVLEETLLSFGIEGKVGAIVSGPTITSFEVHPAVGVKVQKILTLENDIALNLQARAIRIIAPIPGKAAVGIELPNPHPQEVSFQQLLKSYQKSGSKFPIPIILGQAVNGDPVFANLCKFPHCIIAGATGSGKSVCINTMIMSIIMNCRPDEVKLILVDPKKVELTQYNNLPHLVAPVITEADAALSALKWLVAQMEARYETLKNASLRNIEAYLATNPQEPMPYIVCIIDELADLMMVSSSDIETPIARLAQMARAVGIHVVLATQRPSREVITGLIKANFPTRIAFKVASRINSQIILDELGAESLLGNGDMLFLPPGTSALQRIQGAFISDADLNKVVSHIASKAPPNYLIQSFTARAFAESTLQSDEPKDSLYTDAVDIVRSTNNASTTFLQRKLKIGYARAASLMDELEANGVVGPQEGAKPRKIFFTEEE